jgi:hypothetical protein
MVYKFSAERRQSIFAYSLRGLGFQPACFDQGEWIKDSDNHYEYTCTHVDDFCIFAADQVIFISSEVGFIVLQ